MVEKHALFPLLGLSIPFSPSNRFVFDRSFRNRMLYIRDLVAISRKDCGLIQPLLRRMDNFWSSVYILQSMIKAIIFHCIPLMPKVCVTPLSEKHHCMSSPPGSLDMVYAKDCKTESKTERVLSNVSFLFSWFNFLINHLLCSLWLDSWTHLCTARF